MYVISQFALYLLLSLPLFGAYLLLALGIVVIFRASRVLNLAHGAMAMAPAYLVYSLSRAGLPLPLAFVAGVASGAVLGLVVERVFVRTLARQGPTAQTVGTVAVYGLVVGLVAQIYGSGSLVAIGVFPAGGIRVSGTLLSWGDLGLFVVGLLGVAGCVGLLRYTRVGLGMRGAAENPTAAALMGVNPIQMGRLAWALGGGLAGLAGILLAAVTSLNPYSLSLQMLPAFVAAMLGGLGSIVGALVGAGVVAAAQGLVPAFALVPGLRSLAGEVGIPELVLTVVALVVMYLRGKRFSTAGEDGPLGRVETTGPAHSAFDPARLPARGGRRRLGRYVVLAVLLAWPFVHLPSFIPTNEFALLGDANQAGEYFLVAASLVMLTGWVGQISLAQASFVGVGAFGTALVASHVGLPFPTGLLLGAVLGGAVASGLGLVALRVRGLYLAVATLIFAWMCDSYLFVVPWFTGVADSATLTVKQVGRPGTFPFFDFTDRRTFYFVILAASASVAFALLNLRDSKTGRAFAAIRGSETAAAAFGVDVTRTKLMVFTAAGAIAGLAGNLIITNQTTVVPSQFDLPTSLLFLAIVVVGGLRSVGGAVAASIFFAGLTQLFFQVPALGQYLQVVSAALLAVVLLVYPGGMAAAPAGVRRTVGRVRRRLPSVSRDWGRAREGLRVWLATSTPARLRAWDDAALAGARAVLARARAVLAELGRLRPRRRSPARRVGGARFTALVVPPEPASPTVVVDPPVAGTAGVPGPVGGASIPSGTGPVGAGAPLGPRAAVPARENAALDEAPALVASDITVRFGGLTAVSDVSLRVRRGQIVGLIGPNGAGKTTLFNAVSGLNSPSSGTVRLFDEDVTGLPPHQRAVRGLSRTFQVIQLFPELTVFDNLLVATHVHNPTGAWAHVIATGRAVRAETAAEETCRAVVRLLGLEEIADLPVAGLSFGTLRLVEFARALASGAPLVMLDEPASGLDETETEQFAQVLLRVRRELDLSILLIEHDVDLVTAVSDYIYVVDRGRLIAEGGPEAIRNDPAVIAAYLGSPAGPETESGVAAPAAAPVGAS